MTQLLASIPRRFDSSERQAGTDYGLLRLPLAQTPIVVKAVTNLCPMVRSPLIRVDQLFQRTGIAIDGNRCRGNVELPSEPIKLSRSETNLTTKAG
jgi:hypothetical protein